MSKKKALSLVEFAAKYDVPHIRAVCDKAGTTYDYWKRIRDRRQRPSIDLANRLVEASGGELKLLGDDGLLWSRNAQRRTGAPPIRTRSGEAVSA